MCLGVRLCSHLRNHHLSDIVAVLVFCCQRTVYYACHVNIARNNKINNRIVEVDGHILISKEIGHVVDVNAAEVLKLNLWVKLTGSFRYDDCSQRHRSRQVEVVCRVVAQVHLIKCNAHQHLAVKIDKTISVILARCESKMVLFCSLSLKVESVDSRIKSDIRRT